MSLTEVKEGQAQSLVKKTTTTTSIDKLISATTSPVTGVSPVGLAVQKSSTVPVASVPTTVPSGGGSSSTSPSTPSTTKYVSATTASGTTYSPAPSGYSPTASYFTLNNGIYTWHAGTTVVATPVPTSGSGSTSSSKDYVTDVFKSVQTQAKSSSTGASVGTGTKSTSKSSGGSTSIGGSIGTGTKSSSSGYVTPSLPVSTGGSVPITIKETAQKVIIPVTPEPVYVPVSKPSSVDFGLVKSAPVTKSVYQPPPPLVVPTLAKSSSAIPAFKYGPSYDTAIQPTPIKEVPSSFFSDKLRGTLVSKTSIYAKQTAIPAVGGAPPDFTDAARMDLNNLEVKTVVINGKKVYEVQYGDYILTGSSTDELIKQMVLMMEESWYKGKTTPKVLASGSKPTLYSAMGIPSPFEKMFIQKQSEITSSLTAEPIVPGQETKAKTTRDKFNSYILSMEQIKASQPEGSSLVKTLDSLITKTKTERDKVTSEPTTIKGKDAVIKELFDKRYENYDDIKTALSKDNKTYQGYITDLQKGREDDLVMSFDPNYVYTLPNYDRRLNPDTKKYEYFVNGTITVNGGDTQAIANWQKSSDMYYSGYIGVYKNAINANTNMSSDFSNEQNNILQQKAVAQSDWHPDMSLTRGFSSNYEWILPSGYSYEQATQYGAYQRAFEKGGAGSRLASALSPENIFGIPAMINRGALSNLGNVISMTSGIPSQYTNWLNIKGSGEQAARDAEIRSFQGWDEINKALGARPSFSFSAQPLKFTPMTKTELGEEWKQDIGGAGLKFGQRWFESPATQIGVSVVGGSLLGKAGTLASKLGYGRAFTYGGAAVGVPMMIGSGAGLYGTYKSGDVGQLAGQATLFGASLGYMTGGAITGASAMKTALANKTTGKFTTGLLERSPRIPAMEKLVSDISVTKYSPEKPSLILPREETLSNTDLNQVTKFLKTSKGKEYNVRFGEQSKDILLKPAEDTIPIGPKELVSPGITKPLYVETPLQKVIFNKTGSISTVPRLLEKVTGTIGTAVDRAGFQKVADKVLGGSYEKAVGGKEYLDFHGIKILKKDYISMPDSMKGEFDALVLKYGDTLTIPERTSLLGESFQKSAGYIPKDWAIEKSNLVSFLKQRGISYTKLEVPTELKGDWNNLISEYVTAMKVEDPSFTSFKLLSGKGKSVPRLLDMIQKKLPTETVGFKEKLMAVIDKKTKPVSTPVSDLQKMTGFKGSQRGGDLTSVKSVKDAMKLMREKIPEEVSAFEKRLVEANKLEYPGRVKGFAPYEEKYVGVLDSLRGKELKKTLTHEATHKWQEYETKLPFEGEEVPYKQRLQEGLAFGNEVASKPFTIKKTGFGFGKGLASPTSIIKGKILETSPFRNLSKLRAGGMRVADIPLTEQRVLTRWESEQLNPRLLKEQDYYSAVARYSGKRTGTRFTINEAEIRATRPHLIRSGSIKAEVDESGLRSTTVKESRNKVEIGGTSTEPKVTLRIRKGTTEWQEIPETLGMEYERTIKVRQKGLGAVSKGQTLEQIGKTTKISQYDIGPEVVPTREIGGGLREPIKVTSFPKDAALDAYYNFIKDSSRIKELNLGPQYQDVLRSFSRTKEGYYDVQSYLNRTMNKPEFIDKLTEFFSVREAPLTYPSGPSLADVSTKGKSFISRISKSAGTDKSPMPYEYTRDGSKNLRLLDEGKIAPKEFETAKSTYNQKPIMIKSKTLLDMRVKLMSADNRVALLRSQYGEWGPGRAYTKEFKEFVRTPEGKQLATDYAEGRIELRKFDSKFTKYVNKELVDQRVDAILRPKKVLETEFKQPKEKFKASGEYESKELQTEWTQERQPSLKQLTEMERGLQESRYWEGIKPAPEKYTVGIPSKGVGVGSFSKILPIGGIVGFTQGLTKVQIPSQFRPSTKVSLSSLSFKSEMSKQSVSTFHPVQYIKTFQPQVPIQIPTQISSQKPIQETLPYQRPYQVNVPETIQKQVPIQMPIETPITGQRYTPIQIVTKKQTHIYPPPVIPVYVPSPPPPEEPIPIPEDRIVPPVLPFGGGTGTTGGTEEPFDVFGLGYRQRKYRLNLVTPGSVMTPIYKKRPATRKRPPTKLYQSNRFSVRKGW